MKSRIQVPLTKELGSRMWNPESKTVLDYLAWSDLFFCTHTHLVHKYRKPFNFLLELIVNCLID